MIFRLDASLFEKLLERRRGSDFEDAGDARAVGAGAHHLGGCPRTRTAIQARPPPSICRFPSRR